jgi:hypothetical protein
VRKGQKIDLKITDVTDLDARLEPLMAIGCNGGKCEVAYRNSGSDIEKDVDRLAEESPFARAELERTSKTEREQRNAEISQERVLSKLKRTFRGGLRRL